MMYKMVVDKNHSWGKVELYETVNDEIVRVFLNVLAIMFPLAIVVGIPSKSERLGRVAVSATRVSHLFLSMKPCWCNDVTCHSCRKLAVERNTAHNIAHTVHLTGGGVDW
jgi:hypothetical protein